MFLIVMATLLLVTGCASQGQRVSGSAAEAPPPAAPAPGVAEDLAPIPGHPPVTVSGHLKSVDTKRGTITFEDGRTVMVSKESEILVPVAIDKVKPGTPIVVRNALPVAVSSPSLAGGPDAARAASAGKTQRAATVESVGQSDQIVRLTDGTWFRLPSSTRVHRGITGPAIGLADLRPGDELVIVTTDSASTSSTERAPSASPRSTTATAPPRTPSEVMVFTPVRFP
jgi:hypothetical protein